MYSEPQADFIPLRPLPDQGTIGIVAPSSPVEQDRLKRGVAYLEKLGYQVIVGESCYAGETYLAGSDAIRANDLMQMIEDDKVDAIFCARGGFGSMRILKMLDYELIAEKRKLIVGYSDITALHWAIFARTGLPGISGGMAASDFGRETVDPTFVKWFWPFVRDGKFQISVPYTGSGTYREFGTALAGTVSVASKLLGSEYFPGLSDPIYILEDVEEPMHKLEGYMQQFVLAGAFDKAQAILLGSFTPAPKESFPSIPTFDELMARVLRGVRVPVIKGIDYGHIRPKIAMPAGMPVELKIDTNGATVSLATKPFRK